jgi:hypothetical protein
LEDARRLLDRLDGVPDVAVRVKVPEGFAFYTLFPEQYLDAARGWLAAHEEPRAPAARWWSAFAASGRACLRSWRLRSCGAGGRASA